MPLTAIHVGLSELFPGKSADFASFCSLVRTLSRTETSLWCAHLGLILSNPHHHDERDKQQYGIAKFFPADAIARLNQFVRQHRSARVFFREQLLELIRWTSLLAEDHPNDGTTYDDPETAYRFGQAALMASDLRGRRIFPEGIPLTNDRHLDRRRAMPSLREAVVTTAPDIVRALVRGDAFYRGAFQSGYAGTEAEFLAATGLTLDHYMACVRTILVHFAHLKPEEVNARMGGAINIASARQWIPAAMQVPFDRYMELESQTPDQLRAALWGERKAGDVSEAEPFDDRPFRERPLLRTPNGAVAIIMDHAFYAETASVGPLFALVQALDRRGEGGLINEVFGAFGNAFERYINDLLRSMYPASPLLPARLVCNPRAAIAAGGDVEIADACLNDVREAVLFESKGVFVPDEAAHDSETYLVALRKKFGEHEGRKRGAAQLGRWLGDIATGAAKPLGQDWSQVHIVYPVLVVYDVRLDRPGHAEFLGEEFAKALAPDEPLRNGYARKGRLHVAPLILMTISDLEALESSVSLFSLTEFLRAYAQSGARRHPRQRS